MSLAQLSQAAQVQALPIKPDDVAKFVDGLLNGLVQENNFDEIQTCLKDQETLAPMLVEAIDDFKKKDVMDIIKAVTIVGKMLATVETDLTDCGSMGPDLLRIKAWSAIFKNPIKLFQVMFTNTLSHIDAIHTDIGSIIVDAETDQMKDLGEQIADILVLQLGPVPKINDYYFGVFGEQPAETLF